MAIRVSKVDYISRGNSRAVLLLSPVIWLITGATSSGSDTQFEPSLGLFDSVPALPLDGPLLNSSSPYIRSSVLHRDQRKSSGTIPVSPLELFEGDTNRHAEQALPLAWSANSLRALAQPIGELPKSDPIGRVARYDALTASESMLDGIGGMVAPIGSTFEANESNTSRTRFRCGPVNFIGPAFSSGVTYGTYTSKKSEANGAIRSDLNDASALNGFQSTAGISLGMTLGEPSTGCYMALQYGAVYRYPAEATRGSNASRRAFDQQLSILGEMDLAKLKLGFGISFASLSGTNRDLGEQADRDLLTLSVISTYAYTPKTTLDWDLSLPVKRVSGGVNSAEFASTNFVKHRFSEKLRIGIGIVAGMETEESEDVSLRSTHGISGGAGTQTFERLLTSFELVPSRRTSLSGTAGLEYRETAEAASVKPVFGITAAWSPREGTTFSLAGGQNVRKSASTSGQNFLGTNLILGAVQRLGRRMNLLVSLGYEHAEYESTTSGVSNNRVDDLYTAEMGLQAKMNRGWSASISYAYADNRSSTDGFISSLGWIEFAYTF